MPKCQLTEIHQRDANLQYSEKRAYICSVNLSVCLVCYVFDRVCESFGETNCNMGVVECYISV